MISGDARGVPAHRCSFRSSVSVMANTAAEIVAIEARTATTPTCSANAGNSSSEPREVQVRLVGRADASLQAHEN